LQLSELLDSKSYNNTTQHNMADALKAEGNKLFAAKDFDGAV